jgi:transcriptional regulator with XRE-family HTH domain
MGRPFISTPDQHWLKAIMMKTGISLGAVAGRAGVTESYLSLVLSGRLEPGRKLEDKLVEIGEALLKGFRESKDLRDIKRRQKFGD